MVISSMVRTRIAPPDVAHKAAHNWLRAALEAHAAFAAADIAEREYRNRLRALGMRRAEIETETALHRPERAS
jgi:hypothetical protein